MKWMMFEEKTFFEFGQTMNEWKMINIINFEQIDWQSMRWDDLDYYNFNAQQE